MQIGYWAGRALKYEWVENGGHMWFRPWRRLVRW